jgi:hypothetical protein
MGASFEIKFCWQVSLAKRGKNQKGDCNRQYISDRILFAFPRYSSR